MINKYIAYSTESHKKIWELNCDRTNLYAMWADKETGKVVAQEDIDLTVVINPSYSINPIIPEVENGK